MRKGKGGFQTVFTFVYVLLLEQYILHVFTYLLLSKTLMVSRCQVECPRKNSRPGSTTKKILTLGTVQISEQRERSLSCHSRLFVPPLLET